MVAIKCIERKRLNSKSVENLAREIELLKELNHEHIVKMLNFHVRETLSILKFIVKDNVISKFSTFQWDNTMVYIVIEYCSGGDLSHFISSKKVLNEYLARRCLQQIGEELIFNLEFNFSLKLVIN